MFIYVERRATYIIQYNTVTIQLHNGVTNLHKGIQLSFRSSKTLFHNELRPFRFCYCKYCKCYYLKAAQLRVSTSLITIISRILLYIHLIIQWLYSKQSYIVLIFTQLAKEVLANFTQTLQIEIHLDAIKVCPNNIEQNGVLKCIL